MIHPLSVIRIGFILGVFTFLVVSVPAFAGEQLCTFCSQSAVSEESGPPTVNLETQPAGRQQCWFCAGVQGGAAETTPSKATVASSMSPAEGYDIHVQAPHVMEDGTVGGPFHHFCKGVSAKVLQCLLFETTKKDAPLVAIEYFVAKDLSRKLPLIQWHRFFHDHKVEIATGRVQVLAPTDPETVKGIVDFASQTDGVIYHLWQKGQEFPDGSVTFPQSIGHSFPQPE
jgi:hypothetical protein